MAPKKTNARKASDSRLLRPNGPPHGTESTEIESTETESTLLISGEELSYAGIVKKIFELAEHRQHRSKRAVVAGQGELKERTYDPLFPINPTFAMLRANLARLNRRTWVTTKKKGSLQDFIQILFTLSQHGVDPYDVIEKGAKNKGRNLQESIDVFEFDELSVFHWAAHSTNLF